MLGYTSHISLFSKNIFLNFPMLSCMVSVLCSVCHIPILYARIPMIFLLYISIPLHYTYRCGQHTQYIHTYLHTYINIQRIDYIITECTSITNVYVIETAAAALETESLLHYRRYDVQAFCCPREYQRNQYVGSNFFII